MAHIARRIPAKGFERGDAIITGRRWGARTAQQSDMMPRNWRECCRQPANFSNYRMSGSRPSINPTLRLAAQGLDGPLVRFTNKRS